MKGNEILLEEFNYDAVQNDCQGDVFACCIHILGICFLLDLGVLVVCFQAFESCCNGAVDFGSSVWVVQNVVCIAYYQGFLVLLDVVATVWVHCSRHLAVCRADVSCAVG